jgi:glutaconate CoA-transferase subunit B
VGFLGAAQIDRYANLNSTVIGEYEHPRVRLPGGGGAPEIAASCRETFVMLKHTRRTFVEKLDFVSTVGYGAGPGARERLGLPGRGVTAVITDLCILEPNPQTCELEVSVLHPGVTVDAVRGATGWPLEAAGGVRESEPPTAAELSALRALQPSGNEGRRGTGGTT